MPQYLSKFIRNGTVLLSAVACLLFSLSVSAENLLTAEATVGNGHTRSVAAASATETIASGAYYINSNYSGRYLTVSGVNVVQKAKTEASTQLWYVTYEGDGYYSLEPDSNSGYRLDVANAADADGTNVGIHPENGNDAQKYQIISCGSGAYRIQPAISSTRVLDVAGPSTAENANVQIRTYDGASQQKWTFELVLSTDQYGIYGWSWVFTGGKFTKISSGYRTTSRPTHYGIDLSDSGISGTAIYSPTSGVVRKKSTTDSEGGNMVVIQTNNTTVDGIPIRIAFLHMTAGSITLKEGDTVSVGTKIGTVGNTGNSTGAHLHLSTFGSSSATWAASGTAINPQRFFPGITFTGDVSTTFP